MAGAALEGFLAATVSPDRVEVAINDLFRDPHDDSSDLALEQFKQLASQGADVDLLRQMTQLMAQRLMELDLLTRCGAGYEPKTPETGLNSRNGCSGAEGTDPGRSFYTDLELKPEGYPVETDAVDIFEVLGSPFLQVGHAGL